MFNDPGAKRSSWVKFLPWGVLIALAVAGAFIYFTGGSSESEQELTGVIRVGDPDFERYQSFLELKDVKIQMGLNFAKKRVLMLGGILVNKGDRPIDVLEVKVIFFNYETPIQESLHLPIKPGPYVSPVEALSERAFSFYIEEFPKGWLNSHAEMHLNGFRFAERRD